jgi:hypothetical protein
MAGAAWLQPIFKPHPIFPAFCRRPTFPAILHRFSSFSSAGQLVFTTNRFTPVHAQAKRGFSLKEDEVASGKSNSELKTLILHLLSLFLIDFAMD